MSAVLEALLVGPSVADLKREILERDLEIKDLREQVRAYQEADQRDFLNDNSDQLALIIQTKNQVIQSLQTQLEQQGLGTEYAKALDGEASSVAALTKLQDQLHELREQLSEHCEGEAKAKKELVALQLRIEAGKVHAADGPGNGKATPPPKASAMAAEAGPAMPCHIGTQVAPLPATAPAQEPMADAAAPPAPPAETAAPAMPPPPPPPGPPPAVAEAARLREEVASLRSQLDAQQQTLATVQYQRDQVANEVQTVWEAKRNDASEIAQLREEVEKLRPALEQKDAEFLRISTERDQARQLAEELRLRIDSQAADLAAAIAARDEAMPAPAVAAQAEDGAMRCKELDQREIVLAEREQGLIAREQALVAREQSSAQGLAAQATTALDEARQADALEIARLREELGRQRLELDQKEAELRPALEKEAELLRAISERDQARRQDADAMAGLAQELERLRPVLEQKEAELLRACTERDQAREGGVAEVARLQEELERLRPALEQKEAELLRASSERDQDRRLAEQLHSRIESQAADLANALAGRDEALAAASAASTAATAAQAEDAALRRRQLDEREGMLVEREQALTVREETLVSREKSSAGALAQLTTFLDEATGEADALKAEKRSLERELSELKRPTQADSDPENRHLADLCETLGTQVDEWDWSTIVSEVKALAATKERASSRIVELDTELQAARLAAEAAEQTKAASAAEVAALREQLQSLPARGSAAPPPEPSRDGQDAERRAQAAELKLAAAEQKVATVTNTVANLSASLEEALRDNETLKAELDALKAARATTEATSPAAPAAPASSADGPGSGALIPAASKRPDDAQRLQAALQAAETARREAQEAKQACHEATVRAQRLEGQLSRARLGDESVEQEVAKLTGRATTASAFLGSGGIAGLIAASLQDVEMGTSTGVTLNDLGVGDFNALQQVDRYLQVLSALMAVRADARLSVFGLWVLCHSIYVLYLLHAHFLG